jgi:lipopolysaccharide cholinephosphotransferase
MNSLQTNILYIAKQVDQLCKKHNINYFLIGGSALGAFRHKGFIPWDDDFDIALLPKDYEKLLKILKTELDSNFLYFELERTEKWPFSYSKVKLNNTLFIENDFINNSHPGIFIDIFRLTYSRKDFFSRSFDFLLAKIVTVKALKKRGYKKSSWLKKILITTINILFPNFIIEFFFNKITKTEKSDNKLVSFLFGNSKFSSSFFDKSLFADPIYFSFENYQFLAPSRIDTYLLKCFGNGYMIIPDKKNRKTHNPVIVRTIDRI